MAHLTKLILTVCVCFTITFARSHAQEEENSPTPPNGYSSDFAYVRDFIQFQAYRGLLKDTAVIEREGAANSLDKAILLVNRLKARGFKPVIAYGKLRGENLRKAIAISLGLTWLETEAIPAVNPAAHDYLSKILEDHYWVQLPLEDEKWFNLDPSLPGILPGESIASFRKQLARVPAHLFQRVEVIISADFSIGSQRARTRLLRFVAPAKDIISQPMVLMFLNRELDGTFKASENSRLYPVLYAKGSIQPALNLKAEANRIGHRSGGVVPPITMHTIWIDYSLKMPGGTDQSTRRILYSERDPDASRLDEMTVISLFSDSPQLDIPGETDEESLRQYASIAEQFTKPAFTSVLSARELSAITELVTVQQELCRASCSLLNSYIDSAASCIQTTISSFRLNTSPRALAFSIDPARDSFSADILLFNSHSAAISTSDLSSISSSFLNGVAATYLEGSLMNQIAGPPADAMIAGSDERVIDAVALTKAFPATAGTWTAIDADTAYRLDAYRFNTDIARRLENALNNNKILVLPPAAAIKTASRQLVWWEMDAETGTAIGMIDSGLGGAILHQEQTENDWEQMTGSYFPILTDNWGKRLSALCLTAADVLDHGPDNWKQLSNGSLSSAVHQTYEIISDALSKESEIDISPALREFFSTAGRMVMNGTVDSICRPLVVEELN